MNDDNQHIGTFEPSPNRYEGLEFISDIGERHVLHDLSADPDDPNTYVARLFTYGKDGHFTETHEVTTPSRLTEAREAKFEFTERHKRVMKVAAKTITATIAVGTLIAYIRKRR